MQSSRLIRDASFARTKSFPRAGETNYCDSYAGDSGLVYLPLDIGDPGPYRSESFIASLEIPGAPGLADAQRIEFRLQESANEQGPFVDTCPEISAVVTGSGGNGGPPRTLLFGLPSPIARYLVIEMVCSAGAGDPSGDGWITFSLLF